MFKKLICYFQGHNWQPLGVRELQEEVRKAMEYKKYDFLLSTCHRCMKEDRMKPEESLPFVFYVNQNRKMGEP